MIATNSPSPADACNIDLGWPKPRWGLCFILTSALFGGVVWLATEFAPHTPLPPQAPSAAVMVNLVPLPRTQPSPPVAQPPIQHEALSQPSPAPTNIARPLPSRLPPHRTDQPVRHTELRPPPVPRPALPTAMTTMPSQTAHPSAPVAADTKAPAATQALTPGAVPAWQAELLGRLEQFKRYPQQAQDQRQQGVAYLRFVMDRQGRVLSTSIEKTSGHDLLDQETLALVLRAQPLPEPPPGFGGNRIELVVPIQFFLGGSD